VNPVCKDAGSFPERTPYRIAMHIDPAHPEYLHLRLLRRDVKRVAIHACGRLLDIGCGSQPYRNVLARNVPRYVGFDLPPDRWSGRTNRADVWGRAERLPFAEGSFDTVVSFQVLEHLREPWTVVAEAARVLRPGGCLILTTVQHYHVHGEPNDFFRFTRHGLASLSERAGLSVIECSEQGGGWVTVSETVLRFFSGHYWRTVRRPAWSRAICRAGNALFGWLDRRFPYPGNPCNLTLVAQKAV